MKHYSLLVLMGICAFQLTAQNQDSRLIAKSRYDQNGKKIDSTFYQYATGLGSIFDPNDNSLYIELSEETAYTSANVPRQKTGFVYDSLWVKKHGFEVQYNPTLNKWGDTIHFDMQNILNQMHDKILTQQRTADTLETIGEEQCYYCPQCVVEMEPRGGGSHPNLDSTIYRDVYGTIKKPVYKFAFEWEKAWNKKVLFKKTRSNWDSTSNQWKDNYRNVYTYHNSGPRFILLASNTSEYNNGSGFKPQTKIEYQYDSDSLLSFSEASSWQTVGDSWQATSRRTYYRSSSLVDSIIAGAYSSSTKTWNNQSKDEYRYNADGYPTWHQLSYNVLGNFEPNITEYFYYESYTPLIVKVKLLKDKPLVNCYPNPTDHFLNVDLTSLPTGKFSYQLFNANGTKVSSNSMVKDLGSESISLDLSQLAKGVYLLKIIAADHQIYTVRISKN